MTCLSLNCSVFAVGIEAGERYGGVTHTWLELVWQL